MINLTAPAFAALVGPMNLGLVELFVLLVALPITVLWIWALLDCITKEPDTGNSKLVWVIVIAVTGIVGAGLYLVVRRPQRRVQFGR